MHPCVGPSICYAIPLALSHAFPCTRCLTLHDITWHRSHMTYIFQNSLLSGSLEKVCCRLPQLLHTPFPHPPIQGYHLILSHYLLSYKVTPTHTSDCFAYLVFRGEIGEMTEEATAAAGAGSRKEQEKRRAHHTPP